MTDTNAAAITAERLRLFAPQSDYMAWAPALDREAKRVGINTPKRVAAWLGQLHVESQGFTRFEENLNYRTPSRLDAMFSAVKSEADAAMLIARGPRAIANRVYANRNGNGDEASGDGWKHRGLGPIQLTGKANYAKAAKWTGLDLVTDPELVLLPANGAKVAADYWRVCDLNDEADWGDLAAITLAINGPAMAGHAERVRETDRALRIFGAA